VNRLDMPSAAYPARDERVTTVLDGVEVRLPDGTTRTIPIAGVRPPHEKSSDPGTPVQVDSAGELVVALVGDDAVVYDVKTAKLVHRFKSTTQACFFGRAFYTSNFYNPRTGALVAQLGGAPGTAIDCPTRSLGIFPTPHIHLDGDRWAFLARDGSKLVIDDVSTHSSPTVVPLQAPGAQAPALLPSRGKLIVVLTGAVLGEIVTFDLKDAAVQRYPVPTCAPDADAD
jgi:hypothetical protein